MKYLRNEYFVMVF